MLPPTPRKLKKTIADHLVTAISPALIMVLVGSLVFFLAMLLYRGSYPGTLYYTLAWFTFAAVLVVRIDMESPSGRAFYYGIALGGVTILFLERYLDPPYGAIALLGVAWWCAWKLVINCTLIDDDEDATGEGLLDEAGVSDAPRRTHSGPAPRRRGRLLYEHLATKEARADAKAARDAEEADGPQPRKISGTGAPGVWVVYFSLGALPFFGIGEIFLPKNDPNRRAIAFGMLWCYVCAALGLFLTTSFLGLRRYLRQKRLEMPSASIASWLFQGAGLSIIILIACLFLPRPTPGYSLGFLAERAGFGNVRSAPDGSVEEPKGEKARKDGGNATGDGKKNAADSRNGEQSAKADKPSNSGSLESFKPPSDWFKNFGRIAVAIALAAVLIKFRREVWEGLLALWRDLLALFHEPEKSAEVLERREEPRPSRPFAAFKNPFDRLGRCSLPPSELARYTFEALQAWAAERDAPRPKDETPLQFGSRLALFAPEIEEEIRFSVCRYAELAYAGLEPASDSLSAFQKLWRHMSDSVEKVSR